MTDYDTDLPVWSQHQADLLRRLVACERVNDQVDWPHIIEESEAVGQSQVDAVESLLYLALLHQLKVEAWPAADAVPQWKGEARGFRAQARRKFRESMRLRLDVTGLYADALYALPETVDGQAPLPVPDVCNATLDRLLSDAAFVFSATIDLYQPAEPVTLPTLPPVGMRAGLAGGGAQNRDSDTGRRKRRMVLGRLLVAPEQLQDGAFPLLGPDADRHRPVHCFRWQNSTAEQGRQASRLAHSLNYAGLERSLPSRPAVLGMCCLPGDVRRDGFPRASNA